MKSPVAIALDRSMLAANMYRLLLEPMGVRVVNAFTVEEMATALRSMRDIDVLIMSSNALPGSLDRIVEVFADNDRVRGVAKLFLLRESEVEKGWGEALSAIPHSLIMAKPFQPDEFAVRIKRIVALEERGR